MSSAWWASMKAIIFMVPPHRGEEERVGLIDVLDEGAPTAAVEPGRFGNDRRGRRIAARLSARTGRAGGGGMYVDDGGPKLVKLMFVTNSAGLSGGGLYSTDADVTVSGCTFDNNHAQYGGGLTVNGSVTSAEIASSTFVVNFASTLGGGIYNAANNIDIRGSVLAYNYSVDNEYWETVSEDLDQIHGSVAPTVTYSLVHGGFPGDGNIFLNPNDTPEDIFVDADGPDGIVGTPDDDLRLGFGSPCIDAGNNGAVPEELVTDLDGRDRFINDTCKTDTGSGGAPLVDMGAYETEDHGCPTVTGATSKRNHGATSYAIDDGGVECRDGGITKLVLNFDMRTYSTDANELAAGDFTLSSGSVTSVTHLMNAFGQPFLERYIVNVSGVNDDEQFILEFSAENDVGYETAYELCWTALEGDVNGDGVVDGDDETELGAAANPVTESNFHADLDHNNSIEGGTSEADWQVWSANDEDTATVCE